MQLLGDCGFDFLPETDLQKRPGLDVVMTVGLQLCALELNDQQLDTLAFLALAGLLPEFFPHEHWVLAVRKSFLSREIVVCSTRGQWEEVREILQSVSTAEIILKSKNGATLWTKASVSLPIPLDDEFPLRVLASPLNRDQAHMPEVVHIEATGLGGKDIGLPDRWDMSIRTEECLWAILGHGRGRGGSALSFGWSEH